jgi:hypothetical protein
MPPVADLAPVAAAGRQAGQAFLAMTRDPEGAGAAYHGLMASIGMHVGHGSIFDYQWQGNHITGFVQLPQYRDVSNFNVGLFCQQAGLSLDETLTIAGRYASLFSSNAKRGEPYGLAPRTAKFIQAGHDAGTRGVYGASTRQ